MACDAQTLENLQTLNRDTSLSARDLLMCKAYVYAVAAGFPTATDSMAAAMAMGLAKVSELDLDAMLLAVTSNC